MSEEIHCEVLRITWPDWSSVSDESKENMWQVLSQRVEDGEAPSRRGFVGTTRFEDIIAGFFAHEGRRLGVQYDEDWNKEDREAAEFEHLFFSLVLSHGQVILQRKRIGREFLTPQNLAEPCPELLCEHGDDYVDVLRFERLVGHDRLVTAADLLR